MPLRAAHDRCRTCHYRLRRENVCELGVVDKPSLCPRMKPQLRVALAPGGSDEMRRAGRKLSEPEAVRLQVPGRVIPQADLR